MSSLTPKQERFVAEYLVDLNATQAAIRAGYSARTANEQGCRLLTNVSVARALAAKTEKQVAKVELTAEYVLEKLQAEATRTGEGSSHGARVAALGLLGKYFSLFIERQEVTVTHRFAEMSDDELRFEAAALIARTKESATAKQH